MISVADLTDASIAAEVHALLQAAYGLERTRIGVADFPPLRESLEALRQADECFLVFVESERILGALSYRLWDKSVRITRLVVSPDHLRNGIASALLRDVEERTPDAVNFHTITAERNEPAIRMYKKHGYQAGEAFMSVEGILLRALQKRAARSRS